MLENLRFDPNEETNGQDYAKLLASFADIYITRLFHALIVLMPLLILLRNL